MFSFSFYVWTIFFFFNLAFLLTISKYISCRKYTLKFVPYTVNVANSIFSGRRLFYLNSTPAKNASTKFQSDDL